MKNGRRGGKKEKVHKKMLNRKRPQGRSKRKGSKNQARLQTGVKMNKSLHDEDL